MNVIAVTQQAYNSLSSFVSYVYSILVTIIDINFKAVTVTVETCQDIYTMVVNVFKVLNDLLSNVFSSAFDFVVEMLGLVHALLLVLWKFLVFLSSICYSIYQCIEILLYFVFNHVIWLFRLLLSSASCCKDSAIKLYEFISYYSVLGCEQILAGIGIIGTAGFNGIAKIFTHSNWALTSLWSNIDNGMMAFAESVRYITDITYYGMIDLMYLKQETYMGLLICLLIILLIVNVFKSLRQRGLTFPGIQDNLEVGYARVRPNFGFDFSDNEEDESDENNDESDITVASSEADDDDDDEVDEYEVDDLTTDDEELSDTDSSTSIDIQLPPVSGSGYNLRRSATPGRGSIHSSEDFQKEIEKEKEKIKCVVCQDNDKSVLILPCKHLCLCLHCGNTIARSRNVERRVCPLCRQKIETIMNVFT